jgi:hypothetical protein
MAVRWRPSAARFWGPGGAAPLQGRQDLCLGRVEGAHLGPPRHPRPARGTFRAALGTVVEGAAAALDAAPYPEAAHGHDGAPDADEDLRSVQALDAALDKLSKQRRALQGLALSVQTV